jgi:hypothetical protein
MRVSDRELLSRIESLAREERAATVEILLHLDEVERRRLHLTLPFADAAAFVRKLEEARAILSSCSPGLGLEEVLETALDAFLDRERAVPPESTPGAIEHPPEF